jgi:hypothetical protein
LKARVDDANSLVDEPSPIMILSLVLSQAIRPSALFVVVERVSVGVVKVLLVRVCAVDTSTVVAVSIAIVPDVVIAPPDRPVPAVIDVTVPAP